MKITTVTRMPRKKRPPVPVDEIAQRVAAKEFGRLGGLARGKALSSQQRRDAARHAARKRWGARLERMALAAGLVQSKKLGENEE